MISSVVDFAAIVSAHAAYACAILISSSATNPTYEPHSSATLIGSTHAITASHNFDSSRARLALKEGRLFLSCPGQPRVQIRASLLAPKYKGCSSKSTADADNDIAVILTTPVSKPSSLKIASSKETKELRSTDRCSFLGYSPMVCELSPARFPQDCERALKRGTLAPYSKRQNFETASAYQSKAKLDAGDSGSGLICQNKKNEAYFLAVNMAATVESDSTMYSTSAVFHNLFMTSSLALSDREFVSQAKTRLKTHESYCP